MFFRSASDPTIWTVLLRRMIRTHLRRSRPEKILTVFQRIYLRLFSSLSLASGRTSFASSRRQRRTGSCRMLKKSASLSCSFGLFGLSGLSGLSRPGAPDRHDRPDRPTRQTGLVPHMRTIDDPACLHSFSQPARRIYPAAAGQCIQITRQTQRNEQTNTASRLPRGREAGVVSPTGFEPVLLP